MNQKRNNIEEHIENEEIKPVEGAIDEQEINIDNNMESDEGMKENMDANEELAEMRDKFLRLYSEFDNYRKRTQKERLELFKSAGTDIITSLLPVLDDFERALKYAETNNNKEESKSGVELIFHKLKTTLEGKGLKRMYSVGEDFNDEFHEAIANIPAPEESMKGKVVDESECGYFLNDKVIRHAKVIVGN